MNRRVTLTERGFALPAEIPTTRHPTFDRLGVWHGLALTKALRDFLRPDLQGRPVAGPAKEAAITVINDQACKDGFSPQTVGMGMGYALSSITSSKASRQIVAAWIGLEPELIWPHHAHGNTLVLSQLPRWEGIPNLTSSPARTSTTKWQRAILIAAGYTLASALCTLFVRPALKRDARTLGGRRS